MMIEIQGFIGRRVRQRKTIEIRARMRIDQIDRVIVAIIVVGVLLSQCRRPQDRKDRIVRELIEIERRFVDEARPCARTSGMRGKV
jgi:hypothetical protein